MAGRPLAAMLVFVCSSAVSAQEPKLPDVKTFDKLVVDTLRDVHNAGADLYNMKKEFEGTYRMYHGALLTIRPLLGHRPAAQKLIDDGLADAEKETSVAQKAFKLHEAIEAVRSNLKGEPAKKPEEAKPPEKKPEEVTRPREKKPEEVTRPREKKPEGATAAGGPGFRGRVTLKGQPLGGGEITFVSLDQPRPRVYSATIQADGQYAPMGVIPPGKYVVIVTGPRVPEKFQLTTTSGLVIEVPPPPSVQDIELK